MQGSHILLFEPDPATRRQVSEPLRAAGHVVVEVSDLEAALARLDGRQFAMIIAAVDRPPGDALAGAAASIAAEAGSADAWGASAIAARARGGSSSPPAALLFLAHPGAVPALRPMLDAPFTDCIVK